MGSTKKSNWPAIAASLVIVGAVLVGVTAWQLGGDEPKAPTTKEGVSPRSPLAEYLGFGHDPVADERQVNIETEQREEFIADCMANAGFEYYPLPPDTAYVMTIDGDHEIGLGETPEAARGRNAAYVASLDGRDQARYWQAFHGFPHNREGFSADEVAEFDEDRDGVLTFDEISGDACIGLANREVPGVYAATEMIGDHADRLISEVEELIASAKVADELASCVAEATDVSFTPTAVVTSLANDEQLRERPEVQRCVADYKSAVSEIRVEPETVFFAEHEDVIRQYGVPAP